MLDLANQIARLELRAEQMSIHLQSLGRNAPKQCERASNWMR